jgi:hypothetical protein
MNIESLKAEIENQRKRSVFVLAGFCIMCFIVSKFEEGEHGFELLIIFTGLFVVLACVFEALQKLLPLFDENK